MRGGEDDEVPVPDARQAELGRGVDAERDLPPGKPDRTGALFLEREEGILHRVPVVPPRRIGGGHAEELELDHLAHGGGAYAGATCGTRCGDNRTSPCGTNSGYRGPADSGYRGPILGVSRTENQKWGRFSRGYGTLNVKLSLLTKKSLLLNVRPSPGRAGDNSPEAADRPTGREKNWTREGTGHRQRGRKVTAGSRNRQKTTGSQMDRSHRAIHTKTLQTILRIRH